jgi:hypothetical protein
MVDYLKRSGMKIRKSSTGSLHFPRVSLAEANKRAGKHHKIVRDILSDLAKLDQYSAIKIDLVAVAKKKADLRAALHRAARNAKIRLATTSDKNNLYVFRQPLPIEKKKLLNSSG